MTLAALTLAAIMSLPVAAHIDAADAQRYANDIALAAGDDVEVAMALVATANAESDFDKRVETCRRTGDNGAAVSQYQLHRNWWGGHSRAELCGSNALATALAGNALRTLRRMAGSWRAAFRRYVGCNTQSDPHLRKRAQTFERLMANAAVALAKE